MFLIYKSCQINKKLGNHESGTKKINPVVMPFGGVEMGYRWVRMAAIIQGPYRLISDYKGELS